jgi:uncharacterized protein involved in exopolysaccharide biosynthesis
MKSANPVELDSFGMARLLWQSKWIVIGLTCACGIVAAVAATLVTKQYRATAVLAVAQRSSGGMEGLGAVGSRFGDIASLAGISVHGDNEKSEVVATLQSDVLTRRYIQAENLLPILFSEQWDASGKKWKSSGSHGAPTLWQGAQRFKDFRDVAENTKTGLITLSIKWKDPNLAARWASGLVNLTNEYMREAAITRSERNMEYLRAQAEATSVAQLKTAIYQVLESEIKTAMLARGTEEFALKTIDPAVAPEVHAYPKRTIWTALGIVIGFLLSMCFVLLPVMWRAPKFPTPGE